MDAAASEGSKFSSRAFLTTVKNKLLLLLLFLTQNPVWDLEAYTNIIKLRNEGVSGL